eukprot:CAMPEP_0194192526 /NCGR_PEP_ID=MMETSP0154-20130528/71004_1 /TAXON_ID=1049557 /ORGANISM="Thalassiothrix antarctica, Strain L6-D1" /LENGTH=39 /DNA_ID= /DNA_START= /DNA_END= /DNA_ORIENTATION=
MEDEELQLSQVAKYVEQFGFGDQVKIGVKELNNHLEEAT